MSTQACAEDVLLNFGTWRAGLVEKELISVENRVAEELVNISMESVRARFENGIDIAAAVAALAGIVEGSLNLEFLNDVGVGQRGGGELGDVVVAGADAFDQVVVIVVALAVNLNVDVATPQLRRGIQFALSAGR